ncbi:MAG: DUF3300 domain-containing protein [Terracidiphilus sp.]
MKSPIDLRAANIQYFLRSVSKPPAKPSPSEQKQPPKQPSTKGWRAAAILFGALTLTPALLGAQQPYPPQQYGYGDPNASQYTQPAQQNPYAQPQYQQPQYAQPQYQQPQYAAPQQYPAQPQTYPDQQQYANTPYANQGYPSEQDLAAPAPAPVQSLSADQLEQMLAPIALYPDALLAQILAASTYPAQVAAADQWLQQMRGSGYSSPDQIAAGATQQTTWDPSIKALTAFPDVLDMLNHNLEWTTALGNAYYNQPQDVMQTVQVLRERAQQAGNLQSTPQEDVESNQGYVDIAPPNPQVVYVPTYNPWDVYGQPISPYPGFSLIGALGSFFGAAPIQYGLSFALGAFAHTPFGLLAWGLDWLAHAILFDHGAWNSRSTTLADWGLPHGGPRAFPGWHEPARGPGSYYRGNGGTYAYNQRGNFAGGSARPGNFERPAFEGPNAPRTNGINRGAESFNRGYQPSYNGYTHAENPAYAHPSAPGQQAYNRVAPQSAFGNRAQQAYSNPGYGYRPQTYPNRTQTYASRPAAPAFSNPGYGYANRSTQAYAARPGYGATSPYSSYRAPQFDSRAYGARSNPSYGNSYARNESGGFRGFGGEKAPKFSAPKYSYKEPKSFGHQSFGHEKAPKAPKMSHSSGGGGHKHFG